MIVYVIIISNLESFFGKFSVRGKEIHQKFSQKFVLRVFCAKKDLVEEILSSESDIQNTKLSLDKISFKNCIFAFYYNVCEFLQLLPERLFEKELYI